MDEYQDIFEKGIHNENSDTMTLGKFRPTINPDGSENWKIAGKMGIFILKRRRRILVCRKVMQMKQQKR